MAFKARFLWEKMYSEFLIKLRLTNIQTQSVKKLMKKKMYTKGFLLGSSTGSRLGGRKRLICRSIMLDQLHHYSVLRDPGV